MASEESGLQNLICPLCGSAGTLHPIRMGRRFRAGPFSLLMTATKTHQCKDCGTMFSTGQLLNEKKQSQQERGEQ
jgi:hypothetical protein